MSIVGIPAIIRENAEGKDAAKLFALVSLILIIAPSIAPTIGNFILSHQNWHWIFYFMSTVALLTMLMAIKFIPHENKTKLEEKVLKQSNSIKFIDVFKKRAMGYMIAQGFAFAVMMTYVANSAMVYMFFLK